LTIFEEAWLLFYRKERLVIMFPVEMIHITGTTDDDERNRIWFWMSWMSRAGFRARARTREGTHKKKQ
jgi:hypothetical protein